MALRWILLMALFSTSIVVLAAPIARHLIIGNRVPGDRLIQRELLQEDPYAFGEIITRTLFMGDGRSKITNVRIEDQHKKSFLTTVEINAGGVGYSYIIVTLHSNLINGMKVLIEIYGK